MSEMIYLLFLITLLLVSSSSSSASEETSKTYIVRVQHDAKPSIFPTHTHWYHSLATSSHKLIHTYDTVFHGFSAKLTPLEASTLLSSSPYILSLIPEQIRRVHTTRSPEFLGLKTSDTSGLLKESDFGSDLVIGVLDTGIWPERESFNDRGLGPVPGKWRGACEGEKVKCNRKLIGAKYFSRGYEATNGKMNETVEHRSPRDSDGHGTHTASIAAGRYVFPASTLGYARGVAAGMAPKARLAAYKVCWLAGCFDSDILAAFDAAVNDGV